MENNKDLPTTAFLYKLVVDLIKDKIEKTKPNRKLRFVIYARKSTNDEEHQVKSIPEQLADIDRYVKSKENEFDVCPIPVLEKESAKFSGIRPLFKQMLKDIEIGKYDGIIAWHPDRLARNMMEAGIIIDMLDKGIIRDLRFSNFNFDNSSSGKLSLGIAFVMSKQYTDHLTEQINRGNKYHVERGSSIGRDKHGYYRDENNNYRPDGKNFDLICKAWKMRIEGDGMNLSEIAEYLNKNNYEKAQGVGGKNHKLYNMTEKTLSPLFKDTLYAGVLKIGDIVSNLTELYNFIPAVSVADYLYLNSKDGMLKSFVTKKGLRRGNVKGNFLRRTVICDSCGQYMTTAVTTKYSQKDKTLKQRIYYFRCKTKGCKRTKKNVRGKVVMNQIIQFIKNNFIASPAYYENYVEEMNRLRVERRKELNNRKMSLVQENRHARESIDELKKLMAGLATGGNKEVIDEFQQDLKVKLNKITSNEGEMVTIEKELASTDKAILNYQEFVELMKLYPNKLANLKTLSAKSDYIKKMVANCNLLEEKIVSYRLSDPFDRLIPSGNLVVSSGSD